ncbi:MAG: cytochrome c [Arcobacteraceae bacterium]
MSLKTPIKLISGALLFIGLNLYANELKSPELIFLKKCQMCHALEAPNNDLEKKAMAAPYMSLAMNSVTIGIDAMEEPKNNTELRELTIAHIEDYIFNPTPEKSFCEDIIFNQFRYMPSLEKFISIKEAKIVAPWVYDTFAPKQYQVK